MVWEVGGCHAVKPAHPFFQAAVIGIDVIDMQVRCLRPGDARRGENVDRHPRAAREGLDGGAAVAAEARRLFDDRAQNRGDAGRVETRQDAVDRRPRTIARHDDGDWLRGQAAFAGLAAPFAWRSR